MKGTLLKVLHLEKDLDLEYVNWKHFFGTDEQRFRQFYYK